MYSIVPYRAGFCISTRIICLQIIDSNRWCLTPVIATRLFSCHTFTGRRSRERHGTARYNLMHHEFPNVGGKFGWVGKLDTKWVVEFNMAPEIQIFLPIVMQQSLRVIILASHWWKFKKKEKVVHAFNFKDICNLLIRFYVKKKLFYTFYTDYILMSAEIMGNQKHHPVVDTTAKHFTKTGRCQRCPKQ